MKLVMFVGYTIIFNLHTSSIISYLMIYPILSQRHNMVKMTEGG